MVINREIAKAIKEAKIFKIKDSFYFAVQIPDNSAGISWSRCSFCNEKTTYCEHICKHCNFPFIGPFGFPPLHLWVKLTSKEKKEKAQEMYSLKLNYGRLVWRGTYNFPLNPKELIEVLKITGEDEKIFFQTHLI